MEYARFLFTLAACCLPLATAAQPAPPAPPPGVDAARAAAVNALSTDHRAKVQAVVDRVRSGATTLCGGATSIDAVLTPTERQQILAQSKNMFYAVTARAGAPAGPPAALPPPGAGYRVVTRAAAGPAGIQPDPGEVLLMLLLPPPSAPQVEK